MRHGLVWVISLGCVACADDVPSVGGSSTTNDTSTTGDASSSSSGLETTIDLETTATETVDSTSTSGPPPQCEDPDGTYTDVCPPDAPFCVGWACVRCSDTDPLATCATAEGAPGPVCDVNGACVQCTAEDATACSGTTPICDPAANACTACTAHNQCPGDAGCHLFEGSCLPSDAVFMVDSGAPMCDQAGQPYCSITSALAAAGTGTQATIRVAAGAYIESVVIGSDAVVAIVGTGDVTIAANGGSPSVQLSTGGTGYLSAMAVDNLAAAPGIESAGDLRLDGVTIQDADTGLLSTEGRVHLEGVRIINNALTGVSVGGMDDVVLRNVIIAANGTGTAPRGFVTSAATPFSMVYTTIAFNAGTNAGAINCAGEATRTVRNSILVSNSFMNTINCGESLTVTNSVVADPDHEGEPTNVPVLDDTGLLFGAAFEIGTGSVAEGVAVWLDGDPLVDINGTTRPGVDGSPDAAGANVPN